MAVPTDDDADGADGGVVSVIGTETKGSVAGSGSGATKRYEEREGEKEGGSEAPARLESNADPGYLAVGNTSNKGGASATNDEITVEPKKTGPKRKPSVYLGFDEEDDEKGTIETSEL
jgi:hypothetical protein